MFQNLDIKVPNAKMANFKGEHEGTRPPTACAVSTCFNAYLSDFQVSFTHLVSLLFWLIILQLYTYTHTHRQLKNSNFSTCGDRFTSEHVHMTGHTKRNMYSEQPNVSWINALNQSFLPHTGQGEAPPSAKGLEIYFGEISLK